MCGIFGWISSSAVEANLPARFCELLRHRGPDSEGYLEIGQNSVIGMTRLAINDLSTTGNQPMSDTTTGVSIVLNGEIYNFKSLRKTLVNLGHRFQGTSDTEVVLRSYIQWEENYLDKIEGMFAIAIWDPRERKILLSRDRFGQKPLYYIHSKDLFAFSSEANALSRVFPQFASLNSEYLSNFLAHGYVNNNVELFKSINELPPSCFLSLNNGKLQIEKYWTYTEKFINKTGDSFSKAVQNVDNLITDSVREQIQTSDVQVGVLLSSGIDSSIIAKKALAIEPNSLLFTLGFSNSKFDESHKVKEIFSKYKNQLIIKSIDYDFSLIRQAIKGLDVPIGDSSVIAMHTITNLASQYVKTCLAGDGADEIFAGYSTYQATILNEILTSFPFPKQALARLLDKLPKKSGNVTMSYKIKSFLQWNNSDSMLAHQNWRRIFSDLEIYRLTGIKPLLSENYKISMFFESDNLNLLEKCLIHDVSTWLPNDILIKTDRVAMANSLELRAPYLSRKLVEYAASLPIEFKYHKFEGKKILKNVYSAEIGKIGKYPRKKGFGSPVSQWILDHPNDFREAITGSNLFDNSELDLLFKEHKSHRKDNGQKIYSLLVYAMWKKNFEMKG